MIIEKTPLNLNEVKEIMKNLPDDEKKQAIELYLKKFLKTNSKNAIKIAQEIEKLDLLKIKKSHIVKIIDLMPKDASDLNKIFDDISLNEDETNKILKIIKETK